MVPEFGYFSFILMVSNRTIISIFIYLFAKHHWTYLSYSNIDIIVRVHICSGSFFDFVLSLVASVEVVYGG